MALAGRAVPAEQVLDELLDSLAADLRFAPAGDAAAERRDTGMSGRPAG
jgi:hypothetical protein